MSQQEIDRHLDRTTFLECFSTIRAWLEYHHSKGKKTATLSGWGYGMTHQLVDENGDFHAAIDEIEFNYFVGLG